LCRLPPTTPTFQVGSSHSCIRCSSHTYLYSSGYLGPAPFGSTSSPVTPLQVLHLGYGWFTHYSWFSPPHTTHTVFGCHLVLRTTPFTHTTTAHLPTPTVHTVVFTHFPHTPRHTCRFTPFSGSITTWTYTGSHGPTVTFPVLVTRFPHILPTLHLHHTHTGWLVGSSHLFTPFGWVPFTLPGLPLPIPTPLHTRTHIHHTTFCSYTRTQLHTATAYTYTAPHIYLHLSHAGWFFLVEPDLGWLPWFTLHTHRRTYHTFPCTSQDHYTYIAWTVWLHTFVGWFSYLPTRTPPFGYTLHTTHPILPFPRTGTGFSNHNYLYRPMVPGLLIHYIARFTLGFLFVGNRTGWLLHTVHTLRYRFTTPRTPVARLLPFATVTTPRVTFTRTHTLPTILGQVTGLTLDCQPPVAWITHCFPFPTQYHTFGPDWTLYVDIHC